MSEEIINIFREFSRNVKDEFLSFGIIILIFMTAFPDMKFHVLLLGFIVMVLYCVLRVVPSLRRDKDITATITEYLKDVDGWEKRFEKHMEYWVYKNDPVFHLEIGEELVRGFQENWMRRYPDNNNNYSFKVYSKYLNTIIEDCVFVVLDGGRYIVPLPKRKDGIYFYESSSLEFRVGEVIGQFYSYEDLTQFARSHSVEVR